MTCHETQFQLKHSSVTCWSRDTKAAYTLIDHTTSTKTPVLINHIIDVINSNIRDIFHPRNYQPINKYVTKCIPRTDIWHVHEYRKLVFTISVVSWESGLSSAALSLPASPLCRDQENHVFITQPVSAGDWMCQF